MASFADVCIKKKTFVSSFVFAMYNVHSLFPNAYVSNLILGIKADKLDHKIIYQLT